MIDRKIFFNHSVKIDLRKYANIRKNTTVQRDCYITGCIQGYLFLKQYHNFTAIDLSRQQTLDADPKTMQQISFTKNLDREANVFFVIDEVKETILHFTQGTVRVL